MCKISKERLAKIIERCGENYISDGIVCTNCGADETFKNAENPEDTSKWYFLISAYKVDNASKCLNCNSWFYF